MDPLSILPKHTTTITIAKTPELQSGLGTRGIITEDLTLQVITELWDKYQHDPYMQAKLHNYVCIQLPTIMENIKKNRDDRQQRIAELTIEQDEFMERFLNMHRYFYVSTTEKFVSYDGKKYEITAEDNILHHILTTITNERQLMEWKQRTKVYIMKRIKDNVLLKSVPESETIQRVLDHLYPALFETKQDAKYFLTIIGDGLFRKNGDVVHFIQPRAKAFLREIMHSSLYLFGINTTHTFKYKYYDHNYAQCRLVKINDSVDNENIWGNILQNVSIDMLCVAAHYSIRYGSSDKYIDRFSNEPTLEMYAFFLRNTSQEQLVCRFIDEYLQVSLNGTTQYMCISPASTTPPNASNLLLSLVAPATSLSQSPEISKIVGQSLQNTNGRDSTTRQITWKNMHYLWRHFLESQQLPTVIFQQNLKTILTQKLTNNYKEDVDTFIGVSSRFMPAIRSFISFWETTVTMEESGEYEIDELCMLYKRWLSFQHPVSQQMTLQIRNTVSNDAAKPSYMHTFRNEGKEYGALSEKQMIDLITYYFPNAEIEKDKYVFNIRCSLWDKQMDVHTALIQMKESLRTNMGTPEDGTSHTKTSNKNENNPFTYETPSVVSSGIPQMPIYATTVYDAYVWYCKYYSDISTDDATVLDISTTTDKRKTKLCGKRPIVSKSYFEKYVNDTFRGYIVDEKYILREWLDSDM